LSTEPPRSMQSPVKAFLGQPQQFISGPNVLVAFPVFSVLFSSQLIAEQIAISFPNVQPPRCVHAQRFFSDGSLEWRSFCHAGPRVPQGAEDCVELANRRIWIWISSLTTSLNLPLTIRLSGCMGPPVSRTWTHQLELVLSKTGRTFFRPSFFIC